MSHDDGGLSSARTAVHAVYVAAADTAGLDPDQHVVVSNGGLGHLLIFKTIILSKNKGIHGFSRLRRFQKSRWRLINSFTAAIRAIWTHKSLAMTQNTSVLGNVKKA